MNCWPQWSSWFDEDDGANIPFEVNGTAAILASERFLNLRRVVDLQLNLNTETVDQADPAEPPCVELSASIGEVLHLLKAERTGCALVCREGVLVGIFTERDALRLMADQTDWNAPIERAMVTKPVTLSSESSVGQAVAIMSSGGYRRMPIVDGENRPVGLLKVSGILHYLVQHFPNVVYTLPPTPHHTTQEREGA